MPLARGHGSCFGFGELCSDSRTVHASQLLLASAVPLQHLDSSLGVEVVYRDYGTSCQLFNPATHSINWPALQSTLLDEFVLAHSLGWWAKALLIRNTTLLWVYSITFELLELTFAVRVREGHLTNATIRPSDYWSGPTDPEVHVMPAVEMWAGPFPSRDCIAVRLHSCQSQQ